MPVNRNRRFREVDSVHLTRPPLQIVSELRVKVSQTGVRYRVVGSPQRLPPGGKRPLPPLEDFRVRAFSAPPPGFQGDGGSRELTNPKALYGFTRKKNALEGWEVGSGGGVQGMDETSGL